MKKLILLSLLLTSLYATEAKVYTGLSAGYLNEDFSSSGYKSTSSETAKFKIGYGIREAFAIEFSINYLKNDKNNFSAKDGDKYGLNVELMKAFDWDIFILPYFKAGIGAGYFKVEPTATSAKDSLNYSSYNLGLGFLIPMNEHLDFEVGYDYKYVSYEKFEAIDSDVQSNSHGAYLGVNVRF